MPPFQGWAWGGPDPRASRLAIARHFPLRLRSGQALGYPISALRAVRRLGGGASPSHSSGSQAPAWEPGVSEAPASGWPRGGSLADCAFPSRSLGTREWVRPQIVGSVGSPSDRARARNRSGPAESEKIEHEHEHEHDKTGAGRSLRPEVVIRPNRRVTALARGRWGGWRSRWRRGRGRRRRWGGRRRGDGCSG